MKLNQEQIDNLFLFTKQHYVYWYDLQCELVDHLIHDIEEMMSNDQSLSFTQAKNKAFKKFGVFGFMDVVEAKQKQLSKKYNRMLWKEVKLFFSIPKILITLTFLLFNYQLFKLNNQTLNITYLVLLVIFVMIYPMIIMYKERKKLKKQVEKSGKKLMIHEMVANLGNFGAFVQVPLQFLVHFGGRTTDELSKFALIYAIAITIITLITYISVFIIPKQIHQKIAENDPAFL